MKSAARGHKFFFKKQISLKSQVSIKVLVSALAILAAANAAQARGAVGNSANFDSCADKESVFAKKFCRETIETPNKPANAESEILPPRDRIESPPQIAFSPSAIENPRANAQLPPAVIAQNDARKNIDVAAFDVSARELACSNRELATAPQKSFVFSENSANPEFESANPLESSQNQLEDEAALNASAPKFHWKPALIQSGIFLGVQHGFRMSQRRTRREFGGEFVNDWGRTVKNMRGWADGDNIFINYVAHPLQGSFTGRIFVNNSDRAKKLDFNESKEYWRSRFKAFLWSAAWSTQFEIGPLSEATIGNVGLNPNDIHKMAWVDMIVTPVAGTAVLIGEDAIDRYVLKNWLERNSGNRATKKIKILRSVLTPTLSLSNIIRLQVPWKRDNR